MYLCVTRLTSLCYTPLCYTPLCYTPGDLYHTPCTFVLHRLYLWVPPLVPLCDALGTSVWTPLVPLCYTHCNIVPLCYFPRTSVLHPWYLCVTPPRGPVCYTPGTSVLHPWYLCVTTLVPLGYSPGTFVLQT